jgi:hypothetical protein
MCKTGRQFVWGSGLCNFPIEDLEPLSGSSHIFDEIKLSADSAAAVVLKNDEAFALRFCFHGNAANAFPLPLRRV